MTDTSRASVATPGLGAVAGSGTGPAGSVRASVPLVTMLGLLSALGPFATDTYIPGLPAVVSDLHGSQAAGQLTLTAFVVGLAVGQVAVGPLSDAVGRKRPLVLGIVLYVVAALACAIAPNLPLLIVCRLAQGSAAASGVVIARAMVRDISSGAEAAALYGRLMTFGGLAPILAPVIGAGILSLTSWRGLFVVLAAAGALAAVGVVQMPETLPPARRRRGGFRAVAHDVGILRHDRHLVGYALTLAFAFSAMFGFISSAPFVLENIYGLSRTGFGIAFGLSALGMVAGAQVGGRLARRYGAERLVGAGAVLVLVGAAWMDVAAATSAAVGVYMVSVLFVFAGVGTLLPNVMAAGLADHAPRAGSAAAFMGALQFVIGGCVAPLAGIGGVSTRSVAILVTCAAVLAAVSFLALARVRANAPPSGDPAIQVPPERTMSIIDPALERG